MQIAIKYCGGCNCTYQRGTAVKKLKALFTEHNYVVGDENWVYALKRRNWWLQSEHSLSVQKLIFRNYFGF